MAILTKTKSFLQKCNQRYEMAPAQGELEPIERVRRPSEYCKGSKCSFLEPKTPFSIGIMIARSFMEALDTTQENLLLDLF